MLDPKKKIEAEGEIVKVLPGGRFEVKLDLNSEEDKVIECYLGGKMRMNYIKLVLGDTVKVEISPYDLTKGIIVYRTTK